MSHQSIIDQTIAFVKKELDNAEGGHDWFHIERVWRTSKHIAKSEKDVHLLVVELGALLHDIADSKFHDGDEKIGPEKAKAFMNEIKVEEEVSDHVVKIIENISFKGGHKSSDFQSIELEIVQDADRLDAIGAIGIARAFNYGGHKGFALYNPEIPPKEHQSKEEYKSSNAPTINHFYEKLLKLKGLMNTSTGKALAKQRHDFMESYLDQFYMEWQAKYN